MSKSIYNLISKISNYIHLLSISLAGGLFFITLADTLMGVIFRYFLEDSLMGTNEIARFSLIWAVMLSANSALKKNEHVNITYVENKLPEKLRKIIGWLKILFIVVMLSTLTFLSFNYALDHWKMRTISLAIPKTIPLLSIPVGMALLLVQYISIKTLNIWGGE